MTYHVTITNQNYRTTYALHLGKLAEFDTPQEAEAWRQTYIEGRTNLIATSVVPTHSLPMRIQRARQAIGLEPTIAGTSK